MNSPADNPETAIREQAAAWLARRQSGGLGADEQHHLNAWLAADANHRREFEELRALWEVAGDLAQSPVVSAERHAPPRRPAFLRPALATACVLLVAALVAWDGPQRTQRFATGPSERKQIVLEDSSRLHLDIDSAITAHLQAKRQRIVVERGEVYFEVEHRPERHFEVEAGAGRIVDIGTRFGVRLEGDDRASVAVAEGEVEAGLREGGSPPQRLVAGQGIVLGSQLIGEPRPINADAAFAWREGRLVFERTPLADAIARANRYRQEPLVIADPALAGLAVSGVFRLDDARGLVWALEQTLPLRAVRRDGRIDLVPRSGDR